jgi:hypothetical protein
MVGSDEARIDITFRVLRIGCQCHPWDYWAKHWRGIARENGVDEDDPAVSRLLEMIGGNK